MNSYTVKIMTFLLCLFILITVTSQIYLAFQANYETETAISYSAVDNAVFRGVYVRNETVLNYDGGGVISYPSPDGSKIAKNSPVAYVYDSEDDILTNQTIEKLSKEYELLKKAQNKGTTEVAQPELFSKLVEEKYQSVAACIEKNDLELLLTERDEMLMYLNILQIVTKKETDYSARTTYLADSLASLKAAQKEPRQTIITEKPGYFVSYTDGYEGVLSIDTLDSLTADKIKEITEGKAPAKQNTGKTIGKIIESYEWKMAGLVDNSTMRFFQDAKVKLKFGSNPQFVDATIDQIKATDDPHTSIIILACDNLTYDLVQHRFERVELIIKNYDGIKVPRKAIRFLKEEKGVYVQLGESISFKKLDVIFEGEDYVVSSKEPKEGYLRLYDDVLVEGLKPADEKAVTEVFTTAPVETKEPDKKPDEGTIGTTNGTKPPAETKAPDKKPEEGTIGTKSEPKPTPESLTIVGTVTEKPIQTTIGSD